MSVSAIYGSKMVVLPNSSSLTGSGFGATKGSPRVGGGLVIESSSRPQKKATAHHMKTIPRKTQPWDIRRKPTVYPPLRGSRSSAHFRASSDLPGFAPKDDAWCTQHSTDEITIPTKNGTVPSVASNPFPSNPTKISVLPFQRNRRLYLQPFTAFPSNATVIAQITKSPRSENPTTRYVNSATVDGTGGNSVGILNNNFCVKIADFDLGQSFSPFLHSTVHRWR